MYHPFGDHQNISVFITSQSNYSRKVTCNATGRVGSYFVVISKHGVMEFQEQWSV